MRLKVKVFPKKPMRFYRLLMEEEWPVLEETDQHLTESIEEYRSNIRSGYLEEDESSSTWSEMRSLDALLASLE